MTYVVTDNEAPVARCQGPIIDVVLDGTFYSASNVLQLTIAAHFNFLLSAFVSGAVLY